MNRWPLPKTVFQAVNNQNVDNFGLFFQKYVRYTENWTLSQQEQHSFLLECVKTIDKLQATLFPLLNCYQKRTDAIIETIKQTQCVEKLTFEVVWRMCIGLGSGTVLEGSGMTFHPILGLPYIPGSSLKGLLRSYLVLDKNWQEDQTEYIEFFGNQDQKGGVEFLDALPVNVPKLEVDILNCHYNEYYQHNKPPGDWQNPIPVYFLTIAKGSKFQTALISKNVESAKKAAQYLRKAVSILGVGAKTRVGYGEMIDISETHLPSIHGKQTEEVRVKPDTSNIKTIQSQTMLWKNAALSWSPGNGMLTANDIKANNKAIFKFKSLEEAKKFVPESFHKQLFEKKSATANATVEQNGNAFKIVRIE